MLVVGLTIIGAFATCVRSLYKGNLVLLIFQAALLVLVYGQIVWLLVEFQRGGFNRVDVGANIVRLSDLSVVSWFFLGFQSVLSVFIEPALPRMSPTHEARKYVPSDPMLFLSTSREAALLFVFGVIAPVLMIWNAGGLIFFTKPGSMLGGQTLLLFLLGVLKWPLLLRIVNGNSLGIMPILGFFLYILFALFTSRFMTLFAIIQLIIASHYFRGRLNFRKLFVGGFSAFLIILVFGAFRDIASNSQENELSLQFIFLELINFLPLVIDWFYTLNTEIIVGVCNVIFLEDNGADFDYLISELTIFASLFPNSLKIDPNFYISDLLSFISDNKFPSSSVVASGFEIYFSGFGYFGIFLYAGFLLFFVYYCEKSLVVRRNPTSIVLSVQAINGIRGSLLGVLLFFGLADYGAFLLTKVFIQKAPRG